jgi:hypothetical protein
VLAAAGLSSGQSASGTARQGAGDAQQQQQALYARPSIDMRWEGDGSEEKADVVGGRDTVLAGLRQRGPLLFRGLRVRMGINTGGWGRSGVVRLAAAHDCSWHAVAVGLLGVSC